MIFAVRNKEKGIGIHMDSITKNRLSKDILEQIVNHSFDGKEKLLSYAELPEGFCNVAYRLELSKNKQVILKVAPAGTIRMMSCEQELMRTEVSAMKLAKKNGIPGVAEIFAYDNTKTICSGQYFIMEQLEGESCDKAKQNMQEETKQKLDYQIGELLHQVNQIKGERFGHFCKPDLQNEVWFDAFYNMMDRVIADGISVQIQIGVSYQEILQKLREHKKYFEEVKEPRLIHFDSWDGNIFTKDGKIVGLIDWERALWAEGLMEDRFRFHSVNKDFLQGYGKTEFTKAEKIRCMWYDVYLYLIMMFEGTFRHYETNDQYNWVHGLFEQVWGQLVV